MNTTPDPTPKSIASGSFDADLVAKAERALKTPSDTGESVVEAATYLDRVANEDGRLDGAILSALEPLLEHEVQFTSEASYLEATRKLAEVAFRHQRWPIANNALFVLTSRAAPDRLPPWARSYRTKLFFRLQTEAALDDPETTLGLLGPISQLDAQGKAVAREYLAHARDFFRERPAEDAWRRRFVDLVADLMAPIASDVSDLLRQISEPGTAEPDDETLEIEPTPLRRPTAPPTARTGASTTDDQIAAGARPDVSLPDLPIEHPTAPEAPGAMAPEGSLEVDADSRATAAESELARWRARAEAAESDLERTRAEARTQLELERSIQDGEPALARIDGQERAFDLGRRHLLVLGASRITTQVMQGIAKDFGVDKDQLRFEIEFGKLTNFNLEDLRYSTQCAGILLGAIPHKMRNVGSESSAVALLRDGEGFPPSVAMYAGTELKTTKTSFRKALEELHDQMLASGGKAIRA